MEGKITLGLPLELRWKAPKWAPGLQTLFDSDLLAGSKGFKRLSTRRCSKLSGSLFSLGNRPVGGAWLIGGEEATRMRPRAASEGGSHSAWFVFTPCERV